jgi:hypothetical protein
VTRTSGRRLLLALAVFLLPGLVAAQSLGDLAARERHKREAAGHREKPRVIGNDDLRKDPASASTPAETSGGDAPAEAGSSRRRDPDQRGSQDPGPNQLEQAQAAVDAARAAVVDAEERVKALGDKLNPMSPSFIYGGTQGGDAVGEEMRTRDELREAEAQLAEVRDALVKASQAFEDVRQRQRTTPPE